jgi:hypothetical protein
MKTYKRTFYWLNTKKFCGGVAVDQDRKVFKWDTAPCYQWMSGKPFSEMLEYLKYKKLLISCRKIDTEIDPF